MSPTDNPAGSRSRPWRWLAARLAVVLVAVLVASLLLRLVGPDDSNATRADGSGRAGGADVRPVQQFPASQRTEPDRFQVRLLDGTDFDSRTLIGRVSVVNVWGSWCGPCRAEAPILARLARERPAVFFLGINVRDSPDAARAFERSFEVPYPSVDPGDSSPALLAFRGALAVAAVPSTVVLDRRGRVAARVIGPVGYTTLRTLVDDAASGPG